ncbi:phosphate/phosphite/phosphonate ABC transporter substrate-binding protein [Actinomadura litoris]|uniref:phosphate/phosphite/phosphonate ABC transporter substrate-binding protein n=1 Tax=Actinomadura litoris TaxID=2678616 RepID=UPI001FA7B198|nr:phosphate/phosphite/phosphonate ABC transporter substrate-binding protein [Actinomadura litoris]
MRISRILLAFVLALAAPLTACGGSDGGAVAANGVPKTLRVGLIPNVAPERQKAQYGPFGDHLEHALGVKVELFVAADYAGVVTALASGRIDLAYLGGLTYVQAERQVELTPLVTEIDRETGSPRYLSAIVVRAASPYRNLRSDIVGPGRTFAFGDVSSTSGSLYPRIMLDAAGVRCSTRRMDECPPLKRVTFTGGHDATAAAVLGGRADAGGIELRILHRLEREGKVPAGALRVIETRPVMGYPWVARTALGDRAVQALARAFTTMRDPRTLELMRARRYTRVTARDYDEVRRQAGRLGLGGAVR